MTDSQITAMGAEPLEEMETCQITGQATPSSEIISFLGYRVSADGKLEIMRRLRAGMAMPGEMETCTIGARFVALIVDGFVIWIFATIIGLLIGFNLFTEGLFADPASMSGEKAVGAFRLQGAINMSFYLLSILYFTYMHGSRGQTLGKMGAKIRVVNLDGTAIGYRTAALRAIFYQGPMLAAPVAMLIVPSAEILVIAMSALTMIGGLWGLADIMLALLDRAEQKSLHDRLASTRVMVKL